jgi:hypothetical protein
MAKLVFGMMQSLDGYVDGVGGRLELPSPGVALHRHFNDHVRGLAGGLYGRRMYEIMRYWDGRVSQPEVGCSVWASSLPLGEGSCGASAGCG